MTTRRADILIRQVRKETNNEDFGANAGIANSTIESWLNDGLSFLEEGINATHAQSFLAEASIDLVANQEKYDLPADYLQGGGVWLVEYKFSEGAGTPQYRKLRKITTLERSNGMSVDFPAQYTVVGKQLWLKPIPAQSKTDGLRVLYTKRLTRLAVRQGTISAVTLNGGGSSITSMYLDTATLVDAEEFAYNEFCSVVDADGTVKMANIKLNGAELAAGLIPVRSDFTYASGETAAVGDYVVLGRNSSTHNADLDDTVDRFLVAYAAWKAQRSDSNEDAAGQLGELSSARESILAAYAKQSEDLTLIPELLEDC